MLSDSSDSNQGDNLPPIHKKRMVWSSSSDRKVSTSGKKNTWHRDSDAESSSRDQEDPSRFMAREDAVADMARDLDLPEEPKETLHRKSSRPPVVGEAGGSRWQDAPEPSFLPKVKDEEVFYDSDEAVRLLQLAMQAVKAQKKKKRAKKVKKPDPPGSTLPAEDSLRDLRTRFDLSEGVTLRLPTPSKRADDPPKGFFTLCEGFFYYCFLRFPISRLIIEYLWSYKSALAHILTRGLWHLVGVLVRSFETEKAITREHLSNLLEIRRILGPMERFYISLAKNRKVISGFSSKEEKYIDHFFFVALDEDSVPEDCLGKIVTKWDKFGSSPEFYAC